MTEVQKNPILITMACADLDRAPAAGSVRLVCEWCRRPVWVSPASPYWTLAIRLCCTRCLKDMPRSPDDENMEPTEEQRLEIARETGLYGDRLDRLIKDARDYYRRGL